MNSIYVLDVRIAKLLEEEGGQRYDRVAEVGVIGVGSYCLVVSLFPPNEYAKSGMSVSENSDSVMDANFFVNISDLYSFSA